MVEQWKALVVIVSSGHFVKREIDFAKEPFARWQMPGLDDDFGDLIMRLTKLDPRMRATAQEGLLL